jgi:hypothetical protein
MVEKRKKSGKPAKQSIPDFFAAVKNNPAKGESTGNQH